MSFLGENKAVTGGRCCISITTFPYYPKTTNVFNELMPQITYLQCPSVTVILVDKDSGVSEMAKYLLTYLAVASGLVVAVAATGGSAYAFTETKVSPPATQAAPKKETPSVPLQTQKSETGNGLQITMPGDEQSGGTELKVPGIGSVGVLPKLDFGLELLYGSGNGSNPDPNIENKNGDVQIKGSIKHRF